MIVSAYRLGDGLLTVSTDKGLPVRILDAFKVEVYRHFVLGHLGLTVFASQQCPERVARTRELVSVKMLWDGLETVQALSSLVVRRVIIAWPDLASEASDGCTTIWAFLVRLSVGICRAVVDV